MSGDVQSLSCPGHVFSVYLCDLSLHSSARASELFPQYGQTLAGCRGTEPLLGAVPFGRVGGKALSHF